MHAVVLAARPGKCRLRAGNGGRYTLPPFRRPLGPSSDRRLRRALASIPANPDRLTKLPPPLIASIATGGTGSPVLPTEVVAIDGPSGAGKSTVARQLAQRLGFGFLDTGAMYRAITWHFLQDGCAPAECAGEPDQGHARMQRSLQQARLELVGGRVVLNGRDVTSHLRTREVESQVSAVSALSFVRAAMRDLQRLVAAAGPVVAEGRDMGSVVFPQAKWKVYLDAAPSERARRRSQDFARQGRVVSESDVLDEILVRDRLDSTRSDAPLRQAPDALYVDSTGLTTEVVVARLLDYVRGVGASGSAAGGRAAGNVRTQEAP